MKLLVWCCIWHFLFYFTLSKTFAQIYSGINGTILTTTTETPIKEEIIGVIIELCGNEAKDFDEIRTSFKNSNEIQHFWNVVCGDYITFAKWVELISTTGITKVIIVARRETLRFADSSLRNSDVKQWTSIPINNELLVGGLTQSFAQRQLCKDRAGGKQFWGLLMSLLPDIIDNWQWRNLYLYVDEMFGLSEVKQVHAAFKNYQNYASLKLVMTSKTASPMEFLSRLSYWDRGVREVKSVILICGRQMTKKIIEDASRMKLFSTFYRWLVFENGTAEVLKHFQMQFDTDVIIMRHTDNSSMASSLRKALERAKIEPTPIPTVPSSITTKKPRGFSGKSTAVNKETVDKNVCYFHPFEGQTSYDKVGNSSRLEGKEYLPTDLQLAFFRVRKRTGVVLPSLEFIGQWDVASGLTNTKEQAYDFDGHTLQVVALHCPPYVDVHRSLDGRHTFRGYLVDVLEALSIIMNFKYNITIPFDHTYGRCEGNLCSGIIGTIVRKEADIALANLSPTGARVELMDFATVAVDNAGLGMLLRRPTKSDTNAIKAYIMPFTSDVAICVAAAIPLCGIMLHIAMKTGAFSRLDATSDEYHETDPQLTKDNHSLGRCLFAAVQSFGQQGIDVIPTSWAGRVVFGVMWIFSLFIMSSYTANLISYFTSTVVTWPFKSLVEVYNSRYYQIGFIKGTTYLDDIRGENSTVLTKLWNRIEKQRFTTLVDDIEEGMERVRSENYILIHEARILHYIATKDCEFTMINEKYLSAPMTLAFQKQSQFQRPISQMLLKISESGLLERLKNRWWPPTYDCSIAAQSFSSISLWGVLSVYGILMGGIVAGLLVLGLEKGIATQKIKTRLKAIANMTNIPEVVPNIGLSIAEKMANKFNSRKSDDEHVSFESYGQPSTS
ncbi:Glutamate receptor 2 [Chamberlinius hualienensis]